MLRSLHEARKQEPPEPTRICDNCGKARKSSDMINCIIVVGSPGHHSFRPFQCSFEEHWACSIECWAKVSHACIDEHMKKLLTIKHQAVASSVHHEEAMNT